MSQEFISSQTVRKNYYPPVNNLESDYFRFLDGARHCVLACFFVVNLLIKLVLFHEEKPVEQFGGEIIEGSTEADDVQTVVTVASPNGAEFLAAPPEENMLDVELIVLLHWW